MCERHIFPKVNLVLALFSNKRSDFEVEVKMDVNNVSY